MLSRTTRLAVILASNSLEAKICDFMAEIAEEYGDKLTDGGEPQILLNTQTDEVWVSVGDWHDSEMVRAIFAGLDQVSGVEGVDGESESFPEGYNYGKGPSDWKKIYPE